MHLDGYIAQPVKPWEAASGGTAVVCSSAKCTAESQFNGRPGWYTLRVRYFDMPSGVAKFRLLVNSQPVDDWTAADSFPARKLDAYSSTRREIRGIALRTGDRIRIEGQPGGADPAALDYFEILPDRHF